MAILPPSPQTAQDTPGRTPATIVALDAIIAHERRLERLEHSREPTFLQGLALGVVGMGSSLSLLIGLAVLYGGFR